MRKFAVVSLLVVAALVAVSGCTSQGGEVKKANRYAVFETSMGDFKVELYEDKTPITTANFINLSQKGYYDNTTFHRVIDSFMIQGGDPKGDGTGGPGYTIPDEFVSSLNFVSSGILAMANTGQPNSGGSQFFITLAPTSWLNQKHTIFGRVVEGMDVVKAIGKVQTGQGDRPVTPVIVKTVRIVDK